MDPVPDEIWDEAARHFDEPALAALILSIATVNLWTRLNATTRQVAGHWTGSPGSAVIVTAEPGIEPYLDETYSVGFRVGDQEIGLNPNGHNEGMTGPVGYWHVNDIKKVCNYSQTLAHKHSKRSKMSVGGS